MPTGPSSCLSRLTSLVALIAPLATAAPPPMQRHSRLSAAIQPAASVTRIEASEITFTTSFAAPRHDHPCPVIGQVLAGTILFQIEGQPAQMLHAGDCFLEPAHTPIVHFDNPGPAPARFSAFYLANDGTTPLVHLLNP